MITVHHTPGIPWQRKRVGAFVDGLTALGHQVQTTTERTRIDDGPAVLFGTTNFKRIEEQSGDWLLVDRCNFGDPNQYVSLGWNGRGRRGDHCVPRHFDCSRWEMHGVELKPWQRGGHRVILCGQYDSSSPDWPDLNEWYRAMMELDITHFRPHPQAGNPTCLPVATTWDDCKKVVVLHSSIGPQALMQGIFVAAHDRGSMCWAYGNRDRWVRWLAWTQWHWDEIRAGKPIRHLFDGKD